MHRLRIVTAIVLIAIIACGVLILPTIWVAVLFVVPMLIGVMEWANLAGFSQFKSQVLMVGISGACIFCWMWFAHHNQFSPLPIFFLATLWWLVTAIRLTRINAIQAYQGAAPTTAGLGIFILLSTWGSLIWLHSQPQGPWLLLFLFILIWIADSGAYFAGQRFGGMKLAPLLSPSKTRAGVYGGLIGTTVWGVILALFFGNSVKFGLELVVLCLFTVIASIVGDLYESLLKRQRNLKDSGNLLPGHGGILDRIDSLTAAAPLFVLGLTILGVI